MRAHTIHHTKFSNRGKKPSDFLHPFYQQRALRAFCADKGIVVQVPLPPLST